MNVMLAEDLTGWFDAAAMFFGGAFASLLALGALVPASFGKWRLTAILLVPAIVAVIVTTYYFCHAYAQIPVHNDEDEVRRNYVFPWLAMAGPALATSLLTSFVSLVLWLKKR